MAPSHPISTFIRILGRFGHRYRYHYNYDYRGRYSPSAVGASSSYLSTCILQARRNTSTANGVAIFSNIFPEKSASAAGVRTVALMEEFVKHTSEVHYVTSSNSGSFNSSGNAAQSNHGPNRDDIKRELEEKGIQLQMMPLNDSAAMDSFLPMSEMEDDNVASDHPSFQFAVFDRFYVEEAYSHSIRKRRPTTTLVLDMQDMHSLRWTRQQYVKQHAKEHCGDPLAIVEEVMQQLPTVEDDKLIRELSSIHRCDLTMVCSPVEMELLQTEYQIPQHKMCLASFVVPPILVPAIGTSSGNHDDSDSTNCYQNETCASKGTINAMSDMQASQPPEYVFCGSFLHEPNKDAVHVLVRRLWPRIRAEIPTATLHVYGSYCPASMMSQYHRPEATGVHVHGFADDLSSIFSKGRILLAPLRFGAGIKGKIIEAWHAGLPVVTTPIGSEGMNLSQSPLSELESESEPMPATTTFGQPKFGGYVASSSADFCQAAVDLAEEPAKYREAVDVGWQTLHAHFSGAASPHRQDGTQDVPTDWQHVWRTMLNTKANLAGRRSSDFTQAMLWHNGSRSTEYFSRWIEAKQRLKSYDSDGRA